MGIPKLEEIQGLCREDLLERIEVTQVQIRQLGGEEGVLHDVLEKDKSLNGKPEIHNAVLEAYNSIIKGLYTELKLYQYRLKQLA